MEENDALADSQWKGGGEMTPYEIDILLWYYARCEDHPDIQRNPPIWSPTMSSFLQHELIQPSDKNGIRKDMCYELTPRGVAYVEALQTVPLPRHQWVVDFPRTNQQS